MTELGVSTEPILKLVADEPTEDQLDLLSHPLLQGLEIIGVREGGLVDCWVPTELIDHEEVPVKEDYVESLAEEMRRMAEEYGGIGQMTPVSLGLIEGEKKLKIADGFHRSAALRRNEEDKIYSTVLRTDWDGLYDFRIYTAKDHAQVRFSRVVMWMNEIWDRTPMSKHMKLSQAVLLYRFGTDGSKLNLRSRDVEAAKTWVANKEVQWDIAAMTIREYLLIAENVDPALVEATREKISSHTLDAPTQAIIKIFSKELPNKFEMQNLVMQTARFIT